MATVDLLINSSDRWGTRQKSLSGMTRTAYLTKSGVPVGEWLNWDFGAYPYAQPVMAAKSWQDIANVNWQIISDDPDVAKLLATFNTTTFLGFTVSSGYEAELSNDWTRVGIGEIGPANVNGVNKSGGKGGLYHEVFIDTQLKYSSIEAHNFDFGTSTYSVLVHELGHSMGLDDVYDKNDWPYALRSQAYTIMGSINRDSTPWQASTPMPYDIEAAQKIWGAPNNVRTGNDRYGFNTHLSYGAGQTFESSYRTVYDFYINKRPFFTIYDQGGVDTIDLSGYTSEQNVDLNPGSYSTIGDNRPDGLNRNMAIYKDTLIENAVGGVGSDVILGNYADNQIIGLSGNDQIYGYSGNDLLFGNRGADYINGGDGNDWLYGGKEADTLLGMAGDDVIFGNNENDIIYGNQGNDAIYGGQNDDTIYGGIGNDFLSGDLGDDILTGNEGADTFTFNFNSGYDVITDFKAVEGDKIEVFRRGVSISSAVSGNALLTIEGGSVVELVGVQASAINSSYFSDQIGVLTGTQPPPTSVLPA